MSHSHEHVHDHDHDHMGAEDPYYLDQMCLVALSALFGGVCFALYFWKKDVLSAMLGPQFHPYVLVSGVLLLIIAVVRAGVLWVRVGKEPVHPQDHHEHDHHHEPEHVHGPGCSHAETSVATGRLESLPHVHAETSVATGRLESLPHVHAETSVAAGRLESLPHVHGPGCSHEHDHHVGHAHAHHHGHTHFDHGHADHEHGWAPWRYVVLLVPIILFFLNIPRGAPKTKDHAVEGIDRTLEAVRVASWLGMDSPLSKFGVIGTALGRRSKDSAVPLDFQTLEAIAARPDSRERWDGKMIWVKGQYVRNPQSNQVFSLGRFRMNCCRADAIQLNVAIVCRESVQVPPITNGEQTWIKVTGEVGFYKDSKGVFHTKLDVYEKGDVEITSPDPNPFIFAQ